MEIKTGAKIHNELYWFFESGKGHTEDPDKKWVSVESLKNLLEDAIKHNTSIKNYLNNDHAIGMVQAQRAILDDLEGRKE